VKALKKIGDALDTGDDKGVIIAVAAALLIIAAIVAVYYFALPHAPEPYTDIYVLDAQGKAVDIPVTLIVNQPTTYYVYVENHEGTSLPCEVQLKVTNETISLFPLHTEPLSTYDKTLANGEKWEIQVPVTLHEPGSYSVVFELWRNAAGTLKFMGNAPVLNVDAVAQG
jgi:uncharacterized membrane protein